VRRKLHEYQRGTAALEKYNLKNRRDNLMDELEIKISLLAIITG
jgi:hypothetical protein